MTVQEHGGGRRRGANGHGSYQQPHSSYNTPYDATSIPDYQNQNGQGRRGKNKKNKIRGEHNKHHNSDQDSHTSYHNNNNNNTFITQDPTRGFQIRGHHHRNQQQAGGGSWYTGPDTTHLSGPGRGPGIGNRNGNGNGRSKGKPAEPFNRIISTQQGRVKKTQTPTFGSINRGFGSASTTTNPFTTIPAKAAPMVLDHNPFSKGLPTITRDDPVIVEEREAIRKFILTNYASIQEDNPNLGYLVELCLNSPSKDLHQVIRTYAFSDLMQYKDMDKICGEIFHFYIGISQCRGGHGQMGDDVIMCDCDGRVPSCFTVAFMSLLRDYLELKKNFDGIYQVLDSFKSGMYPANMTWATAESVSSAIPTAQHYDEDNEMCIG